MDTAQVAGILRGVPGTQVTVEPGAVVVAVPAIGDSARIAAEDVLGIEAIVAPTGLPAVRLGVRRGHDDLPLIVTVDDVVFMPAYAADMLVKGVHMQVPSAPSMVAYSEMHRDVRALGKAIDDPTVELDLDTLTATLLVHRCFIAGAVRVGLWPVRVAAWWEYMWARVGADLPMPPFRPDPAWDRLLVDVTEARRHVTPAREGSA